MTDQCSGRTENNWHYYPCRRKATIERSGKFYCSSHDPVAIEARDKKRQEAYKAKCCPCGWKLEILWDYCPSCGKKKGT